MQAEQGPLSCVAVTAKTSDQFIETIILSGAISIIPAAVIGGLGRVTLFATSCRSKQPEHERYRKRIQLVVEARAR